MSIGDVYVISVLPGILPCPFSCTWRIRHIRTSWHPSLSVFLYLTYTSYPYFLASFLVRFLVLDVYIISVLPGILPCPFSCTWRPTPCCQQPFSFLLLIYLSSLSPKSFSFVIHDFFLLNVNVLLLLVIDISILLVIISFLSPNKTGEVITSVQ